MDGRTTDGPARGTNFATDTALGFQVMREREGERERKREREGEREIEGKGSCDIASRNITLYQRFHRMFQEKERERDRDRGKGVWVCVCMDL
jgi:hypothetical protein